MTGEWLIRQYGNAISIRGVPGNRYETERITVSDTAPAVPPTDPDVTFAPSYLSFRYRDGRVIIYPWANILRAEYRPHNQP